VNCTELIHSQPEAGSEVIGAEIPIVCVHDNGEAVGLIIQSCIAVRNSFVQDITCVVPNKLYRNLIQDRISDTNIKQMRNCMAVKQWATVITNLSTLWVKFRYFVT
jgi:hypothetical protein